MKAARPRRTKRTEKRRLLNEGEFHLQLTLSFDSINGDKRQLSVLFFFFCFINWDKKKEPPRGEPYVLFLGKWNEKKSHCITIKISNSTQKVSSSSKIVSIVNLEVIMVPDLVMV